MRRTLTMLMLCGSLAQAQEPASSSAADLRRLADGLYSRGLYELALEEYQTLLAAEPEQADLIHFRAGESARQIGRSDLARLQYIQALRKGGNSDPAQRALMRLADLELKAGRPEAALQRVSQLLDGEAAAGFRAPALYLQGQILLEQNELEAARKSWETLLKDHPDDPVTAHAALQLARLQEKDPEAQRRKYEQALKLAPSPDLELEALWGLAVLESRSGDAKAAASAYWKLWLRFPDSARVRGGLLRMAWAQMQAEEWEKALSLADAASDARKEPHLDTWLFLEAQSQQALGKPDEAGQTWARLRKERPDSRFRARAAYELALIQGRAGKHGEVLLLAEDLLSLPGMRSEVYWLLGENARAADKERQAITYYEALLQERDAGDLRREALYILALMKRDSSPDESATLLERFARENGNDPRTAEVLESAARLRMTLNDWEQGLSLLEAAAEKSGDPELWFEGAMHALKQQRPAQAITWLETYRGLEEATRRDQAAYWLAQLQEGQQKDAEAEALYLEALETSQDRDLQDRIRLRLLALLQRNNKEEQALAMVTPLLERSASELPDAILWWAYGSDQVDRSSLARAMVAEGRADGLRELGFYELAEQARQAGKNGQAVKAYGQGLALSGDTLEAARAGLAFGELQLQSGKVDSAEEELRRAARRASQLEAAETHARSLMALARLERQRKQPEAAAKLYMSVAVLYDDPALVSESLKEAEAAFREAGKEKEANAARKEGERRYPDLFLTVEKN